MTSKEYEFMREQFLTETLKLSDAKRIEYTEGNHETNVLWNFEHIGKTLGLTSMKVLSVYLQKHISSLFNYLKTAKEYACLLYTSPSPRDGLLSRMPSSA